MWVRSTRDLGLLIRDRRRTLRLSQAALAERIGASRHWVMDVEAGKKTVEVGLVLDALVALDMNCSVRPRASSGDRAAASHTDAPADLPTVDFGTILARTRASGR